MALTIHNLYVALPPLSNAPNAKKSRELTMEILKYVQARLPVFKKMGVRVAVHKIKFHEMAKANQDRLRATMKAGGITNLPALKTPTNVYVGNTMIMEVYDQNIKGFTAWERRGVDHPEGISTDTALDDYYAQMMDAGEDGEGEDEVVGGEDGGNMMDNYRTMMSRRDDIESGRSGKGKSGGGQGGRPSNVGGSDDEMSNLIDSMSGGVDSQKREEAFSGGGGDSLDGDDGGSSAQDDLMESAYWANQEASM